MTSKELKGKLCSSRYSTFGAEFMIGKKKKKSMWLLPRITANVCFIVISFPSRNEYNYIITIPCGKHHVWFKLGWNVFACIVPHVINNKNIE